MSEREIFPIQHALDATVRMPGSKSLTNRALLVAALADGSTRLSNALFSDDSRYLANAFRALGLNLKMDEPHSEMTVTGLGGRIPAREAELYIGNAGTAARFLTAFLTLANGEYVVDGDARMRQRPMQDLVSALSQLGAHVETSTGGLPVKIVASGLRGGRTCITGDISSQFLSALLMVAPYARQPVEINLTTELTSRPYVDLTLSVMRDFGIVVEHQGYEQFLIQPARYQAKPDSLIEPDASAASYFFAAPAILGGRVRVQGLTRASRQGDLAFLDVLQQMGCEVVQGDNYIEVAGPSCLRGVDFDLRDMPDVAQTLAAIAPFASTPTQIRGIASARLKETDRIGATCTELRRLGVRTEEHADGMTIHPCETIHSASIQTYNDHRMAMAFALIGLRVPGVVIENPACVSKTFPNYFDTLESLR